MNFEQLIESANWLESKIKELEAIYKEQHNNDFDYHKMKDYVKRKLKRETRILALCSMIPTIKAIKSESFKY